MSELSSDKFEIFYLRDDEFEVFKWRAYEEIFTY
jgi:hypothetical protein